LAEFGYEKCPLELCIMKRPSGDKVFFMLIYVDDILVIVKDTEYNRL
jgi:hypothetical protein